MKNIKFRQPIYRNGKFYKFKYWGFGLTDEPQEQFFPPELSAYESEDMSIDITQKPEQSDLFTGLRDKNKREIFEGDIIVVRNLHDGDEMCWNQSRFNEGKEGAIPQIVTWDEQYLCFDFGGCSRIKYSPYDFEVIGNIHEDSNLLTPERKV